MAVLNAAVMIEPPFPEARVVTPGASHLSARPCLDAACMEVSRCQQQAFNPSS